MIKGRISYIRDGTQTGEGTVVDGGMDGACVIGLGRAAYVVSLDSKRVLISSRSMSILIYDLMLNVFFTWLANSPNLLASLTNRVSQYVLIPPLQICRSLSKAKGNCKADVDVGRASPLPQYADFITSAAIVALVTSAINVCVLTALHGQELGWVCLASCGADVAVNAMVR
jgi:hypothetical protein